jgi:hypothetical protein
MLTPCLARPKESPRCENLAPGADCRGEDAERASAASVALNLRSHHPALIDAGFAELETPITWWDSRILRFRFPPQ